MRPKKQPISKPPARRVAVLVDTSTDWSRRVIAGIVKFVDKHAAWQLFIEPRGAGEPLELPRGWVGDGVIARVINERMSQSLHARRLPVVNVSAIHTPGPEFPRVTSDVAGVARMAVNYFLDRGFRHFAYLSLRGLEYAVRQRDAFVEAVQAAGCDCVQHGVKTHEGVQAPDWNLSIETMAAWLATLPKPVAILTWSGGREVIHACDYAGFRVPEEVALLTGSDDLLCSASHIPISAVEGSCERIGYEAALLLDRLMEGRKAPGKPKLIPPLAVITRQSTNTLAIADPNLVKALSYIRENASNPIPIGAVATHAGIARRELEIRFKKVLGRSPGEHIRRVHLDRAKKLLAESDLPIPDVADAAGFGSPVYMAYFFRREVGITPLRYRREARAR